MIDVLKPLIKQFMPFAQEKMGFNRPPKLFLRTSNKEADDPMGKTGFYDPENESITIYIAGRHPKDIMRSLAHELMHHTQKCNGHFDGAKNVGEQGYAQNDSHMRNMEIQAYQASIVFRDWEDGLKETIYYEHLQKGETKMSIKDWKNNEISQLLSEAWGFKFKSLQEFDEFNGTGEVQEASEELEEAQPRRPRGIKPDKTTSPTQASRLSGREPEPDPEEEEEEEKAAVAEALEDDAEPMEESPSHPAVDREGPRASGRRVKKASGERVEEELKEAILNVLKKHF